MRSANAALLTQNTSVEFEGGKNAEELAKIIDGLDDGASLERSLENVGADHDSRRCSCHQQFAKVLKDRVDLSTIFSPPNSKF
jgi:hypothetical protein